MSLALREAYTARAQTFKQQLELERIGESDSMMKMLGEYMQSLKLGQVDIWTVDDRWFASIGGSQIPSERSVVTP